MRAIPVSTGLHGTAIETTARREVFPRFCRTNAEVADLKEATMAN